jgi:hypothetical protein
MFQTLVTLATVIATAAHALAGCCWHHEHAHHHVSCQSAHKAAVQSECTCQHHKAEEPGDTNEVAMAEPAPCEHPFGDDTGECEGRCQFLTNAKVELPTLDRPNLSAGMFPVIASEVRLAFEHSGRLTHPLAASLLSGSLCVRDLTQVARI